MYHFEKIQPTKEIWNEIENSFDSTCFHSQKWHRYLKRIGHKPIYLSMAMMN